MQWIRNHLSFANAISMIALFVALGGSSIAAISLSKNSVGTKQIKKNGVRAIDISRNAVGASEIRSNAVAGGDIVDNGVGGADIADNGVGGADIADNAVGGSEIAGNAVGGSEIGDGQVGSSEIGDAQVGSSEVGPDALTADDILGSSLDGEVGPDAFARVDLNAGRTLEPNDAGLAPQNKGLVQANVVAGEGGAATGTTCFNLPSRPASAMVVLDNADAPAADRNLVASVAIDRGEDLADCPATHNDARVRIVDGNTETAQNARFFIWFEL
jgi:hypothetical protein